MKRKLIFFALITLLFFLVFVRVKQGQAQEMNQNRNQEQSQEQNQEQYQIQEDQGVSESIPPGWEKKGKTGEDEDKSGKVKKPSSRSEVAREHMNEVAKKVEEILTTQGAKGGIGEQVREIARAQNKDQEETEKEYEKMEMRGWIKKIIGPDYKAINNLRKQMEKNQLRLRQLENLQNQVMNEGEAQMLSEMIEVLNQQNTSLEEQIQAQEEEFSLLGWLFKKFSGD